MTIPRHIVRIIADAYIVFVLFLSTGAFLTLVVDPSDVTSGSSVTKAVWGIIYAITLVRIIKGWRQAAALIRANKPLIFLILLACASVLWSIDPSSTLHAVATLVFSMLFAIDLNMHYTPLRQIQLACVALTLVVGLSVLVDLFFPGFVPTMDPEGSAWCGAFSTKNEFGRIVTLAAAVCLALPDQPRWTRVVTIALGGCLAILTRSVGAVVYLVLLVLLFVGSSALKWGPRRERS